MTQDQIAAALEEQSQQIAALARLVRILIWLVAIMIVLMATNLFAGDLEVIRADRAKFPQSRWRELYYVTLTSVPPEQRLQLQRALDFTVASCSTQQILERSLPVPLSPTVLRLDIRQLKWSAMPKLLMEHYPYTRNQGKRVPAVVRADWLINFLLDQRKSDAYLQLLDGDKAPKNAEELAVMFGAAESERVNNWIEDSSGVAVNKTRLIKSFPTTFRTDLWRTFDWPEINPDMDPLQNFDSKLQGSVSEWIGPLVKVSIATGEQGHLQRYALTNVDGGVAASAPIGIVVDHTPLGPELVNPRSCIACHKEGLRPMSINAIRRLVEAELNDDRLAVIAPKGSDTRERIERQFMANLDANIKHHNDKYAGIVQLITGGTPEEASEDVITSITEYNKDVSMEKACRELRVSEQRMLQALARSGRVPARLVQLAKVPMSRENWEAIYPIALGMVRN